MSLVKSAPIFTEINLNLNDNDNLETEESIAHIQSFPNDHSSSSNTLDDFNTNNDLVSTTNFKNKARSTFLDKSKKVGVRAKIEIDKVLDVDEEIHLYMELVLHYEDHQAEANFEEGFEFGLVTNEDLIYKPIIKILGIRDCTEVSKKFFLRKGTTTVFEILELTLVFHEIFDLQRFPFDQQVFKIRIQSNYSRLTYWHSEHILPRMKNDIIWETNDIYVTFDESTWKVGVMKCSIAENPKSLVSVFSISFILNREAEFYVYNFLLVVFIVVGVGFFVISIPPLDNFGSRSSLTFTLLLTLVAFKFTISSLIPRISYLTWLDKYLMFSFAIIGSQIIENFVVSGYWFSSSDLATEIDNIFFLTVAIIWVFLHLLIILGTIFNWFYLSMNEVLLRDDSHLYHSDDSTWTFYHKHSLMFSTTKVSTTTSNTTTPNKDILQPSQQSQPFRRRRKDSYATFAR